MVGERVDFRDRDSGRGGAYVLEAELARQAGTPEGFLPVTITTHQFDLLFKASQQLGGVALDVLFVKLVLGLPVPKDVEADAAAQLGVAEAQIEASGKLLEVAKEQQASIAKLLEETNRVLELARAASAAAQAAAERGPPSVTVQAPPAPSVTVQAATIDANLLGKGVGLGLLPLLDRGFSPIITRPQSVQREVGELGEAFVTIVAEPLRQLTEAFSAVTPPKELDRPESAEATALRAFGLATGIGFGAHGIVAGTEATYPTKNLGLTSFLALLGRFSSWDPIFAGLWEARLDAAIARPMRYRWAKAFRPELPGVMDLEELLIKRAITRAEFLDWGAYSGLPTRWLEARADVAFRELTLRDIAQVSQLFPLSVEDITEILRKHGYGDREIELLAPTLALGGVRDELRTYRSLADRLFKLGSMDRAEYEEALETVKVDKRFIPLLADLQERVFDAEDREEMAKFVLELYDADELDQVEARQRLLDLGLRAARVEARLNRVDLRKRIKGRKAEAAAQAKAEAAQRALDAKAVKPPAS